jgi:hypothetical protein
LKPINDIQSYNYQQAKSEQDKKKRMAAEKDETKI